MSERCKAVFVKRIMYTLLDTRFGGFIGGLNWLEKREMDTRVSAENLCARKVHSAPAGIPLHNTDIDAIYVWENRV